MNNVVAEERRRFHRALFNADAELHCGNRSIPCRIIDLSLQGCLLSIGEPCDAPRENDGICTLKLMLSQQTIIEMVLSISHIQGDRWGLQCRSIDIDSISNLRRLIELNLGNSDLLERDFAALGNF